MIQLTEQDGDILIPVKVVPGASGDQIAGELDGALKVRVSAPPERGAANKALCKLMAKTLNLRTQQVTVVSGQTSPHKTLRITGADMSKVRESLIKS